MKKQLLILSLSFLISNLAIINSAGIFYNNPDSSDLSSYNAGSSELNLSPDKTPLDSNYAFLATFDFLGMLELGMASQYGPDSKIAGGNFNYQLPLDQMLFNKEYNYDNHAGFSQTAAVTFFNGALDSFLNTKNKFTKADSPWISSVNFANNYRTVAFSTLNSVSFAPFVNIIPPDMKVLQPKPGLPSSDFIPFGEIAPKDAKKNPSPYEGFGYELNAFFAINDKIPPIAESGPFTFKETADISDNSKNVDFFFGGGSGGDMITNTNVDAMFGDVEYAYNLGLIFKGGIQGLNLKQGDVLQPYMMYRTLLYFNGIQTANGLFFNIKNFTDQPTMVNNFSSIFMQLWMNSRNTFYDAAGGASPLNPWVKPQEFIKFIEYGYQYYQKDYPRSNNNPSWKNSNIANLSRPLLYPAFLFLAPNFMTLHKSFIFDFLPSAPNLLQVSGVSAAIQNFFYDPTNTTSELIFSSVNKILPILSNIDSKVINYLKTLISMTTVTFQPNLNQLLAVVNNDKFWGFNYNKKDNKKDYSYYTDAFNNMDKVANSIFLTTTNNLFNRGITIPNDPWNVKVNAWRGSNWLLIVILLAVFLTISTYAFVILHKRINSNKMPDYSNVGNQKRFGRLINIIDKSVIGYILKNIDFTQFIKEKYAN